MKNRLRAIDAFFMSIVTTVVIGFEILNPDLIPLPFGLQERVASLLYSDKQCAEMVITQVTRVLQDPAVAEMSTIEEVLSNPSSNGQTPAKIPGRPVLIFLQLQTGPNGEYAVDVKFVRDGSAYSVYKYVVDSNTWTWNQRPT